jgi:tetratricopeptide (TPR) repeat protein
VRRRRDDCQSDDPHRTRVWPLLLLIAALSIATSAGSAKSAHDLFAYRQLVDEYRGGTLTIDADAGWITQDHSSSLDRAIDPASGWTAIDLTAAAMLHTEACLQLVKIGRRSDALAHLAAATRLVRAATELTAEREEFARRWRDTVAGLLQAFGAPDLASHLRIRAMAWLQTSAAQIRARTAFERGVTSEIQAAAAGPLSGPLPKRTSAVPPEARQSLRAAERHFEQAMAADPSAEAALHLGRVSLLDDREPEAERWLRTASAAHNPSVRYLALMFLGVIAERQERYSDAEGYYRSAHDSFRWGQSAPVAISHLLMRTGREVDAREILAVHFATTHGRVVEPLWTYLADPATDLGPTLNQLRAEIWR